MKSATFVYRLLAFVLFSFLLQQTVHAQFLKDLKNRAEQKIKDKANQKVDKAMDKTIDDATTVKKKTDSTSAKNSNSTATRDKNAAVNSDPAASNETASVGVNPTFKTYSKFDFVPGDKIIVYEDFSKDAIGDFPDKWNTNSGGEVVTVAGQQGHWLMIRKKGRYVPEYITALPDNFTLEFDLLVNDKFNYYSTNLELFMLTGGNSSKDVLEYSFIELQKRSGVKVLFHPNNGTEKGGTSAIESFEDGARIIHNDVTTSQFNSFGKPKVRVAIWRQKQRIRVYLNEEKAFDLPRAFPADKVYNTLLFQIWADMNNDNDRYLINNIKLGVGAPDTRNKLITEGKFVTRGILFDVNSDVIKPQSYGVLKDIANVLTENPTVKIKIVGHTDGDGDENSNLDLSKRRAEAVKKSLASEFGIDAGRMQSDGKGKKEPVDTNNTIQGKANNRRVEFIKM